LPDPDKIYGPSADGDSDHDDISDKQRLSDNDSDVDTSGAVPSSSESSVDDTLHSSSWYVVHMLIAA